MGASIRRRAVGGKAETACGIDWQADARSNSKRHRNESIRMNSVLPVMFANIVWHSADLPIGKRDIACVPSPL